MINYPPLSISHIHPEIMASLALFISIMFYAVGFAAAQCSRPPIIFNFGDSNSDTGGSANMFGEPFAYPDGRAFFDRPTGRRCDGRLIIDFLCESLGTKYLTPFMEPVERNFSNGANFAMSGSTLGVLPNVPLNLDVQIREFTLFRNRSMELSHRAGYEHLLGEDEFRNALYSIDIAQNDLSKAFEQHTYDKIVKSLVPFYISKTRDAMQTIYHLGGRKLWVHGTGPLGCLPFQLANRSASEALDEYGCVSDMNEAAKRFNLELDRLCQQLRFEMEDSTIVFVDVYSIKYDLITASSTYGFQEPLMACYGCGGPPYNAGKCETAGQNVCPYGPGIALRINWDGFHYTEAANAFVASKILSTHYSSPPLPFNFFCNN